MKFSGTFLIVILCLVVLGFIKYMFLNVDIPLPPAATGKGLAVPVTIKVLHVRNMDNTIQITGSLLSNEEVIVYPEVAGRIERIAFREGAPVNKGDLLVKINDADLSAQLKKLSLQISLASEQESRQKKLLEISGISQEDYDLALNKLNTLLADQEEIQAKIAKTAIRAPFGGVIGLKSVSEGSYVSSNTKIASIQQTDPIKIDFSIPEKYATQVRVGDRIHFSVAGVDQPYKGSIYAIEPRIDPVNRTLQLRAISQNTNSRLIPGSFARVELVMEQIKNTLLIPSQALIPELKGLKVFICKNGKATPVSVKAGIRTEKEVQILEGLQDGDSLVVSGFMQLKPGTNLKISQATLK